MVELLSIKRIFPSPGRWNRKGGLRKLSMASINVEARERRRIFVELKRQERFVDTAQEAIQRVISRVIERKRKIPELADIVGIMEMAKILAGIVDAFLESCAAAGEFFGGSATEADEAGLRKIGIDLGVIKGENVLAIDPSQVESYVKLIFKNEKNMREWFDSNPQWRDTLIGHGIEAGNIKW